MPVHGVDRIIISTTTAGTTMTTRVYLPNFW